ncbi:MAG: hypothetical protein AB1589_42780, partial [Cyanobacteriota bacterium]
MWDQAPAAADPYASRKPEEPATEYHMGGGGNASTNRISLIRDYYQEESGNVIVHELTHLLEEKLAGLAIYNTDIPDELQVYRDGTNLEQANLIMAEYMALTGWYWDLETHRWELVDPKVEEPSWLESLLGIEKEIPYRNVSPAENLAELSRMYYQDSEDLKEKFGDDVYEFFKQRMYDGCDFEDGQAVPSPSCELTQETSSIENKPYSAKSLFAKIGQFLTKKAHAQTTNPWETIIPGQSTKHETINKLGSPRREIPKASEKTTLEYNSKNPLPNYVFLSNDTVQLIEYQSEELASAHLFVKIYGQPVLVATSNLHPNAAYLIYPEKGITAIVDTRTLIVARLQKFAPVDMETYQLLWGKSLNQNYQTREAILASLDPALAEDQILEITGGKVEIELYPSWNLISLPAIETNINHAKDLLRLIDQQNGFVSTIAKFEDSQWQEFTIRNDQEFGQDFEIKPYEAYFVRSHNQSTLTLPLSSETVEFEPKKLKQGWNTIAIPPDKL